MLQLQRCHRPVARAGQQDQRDDRSIAQVDGGVGRHGAQHQHDLFEGRDRPLNRASSSAQLGAGRIEVVDVAQDQARAVGGLQEEPAEKLAQVAKRRHDRRLTQPVAGHPAVHLAQVFLESDRLFAVKPSEVSVPREGFEACDGLHNGVEQCLPLVAGIALKEHVFALDSLVSGVVFCHGF